MTNIEIITKFTPQEWQICSNTMYNLICTDLYTTQQENIINLICKKSNESKFTIILCIIVQASFVMQK